MQRRSLSKHPPRPPTRSPSFLSRYGDKTLDSYDNIVVVASSIYKINEKHHFHGFVYRVVSQTLSKPGLVDMKGTYIVKTVKPVEEN